jgi:hypothetical protein
MGINYFLTLTSLIAGTSLFYDLPLFSADKNLLTIDQINLIFYSARI